MSKPSETKVHSRHNGSQLPVFMPTKVFSRQSRTDTLLIYLHFTKDSTENSIPTVLNVPCFDCNLPAH